MTDAPRFYLDNDLDIVDNEKIKIYSFNYRKDWEKLLILLNTLELQKKKALEDKNEMECVLKEMFHEFNNYIDEYSMIKIDILMEIASELGIELE